MRLRRLIEVFAEPSRNAVHFTNCGLFIYSIIIRRYTPSMHMTVKQSRINVVATSLRCIDVDATLSQHCMSTGSCSFVLNILAMRYILFSCGLFVCSVALLLLRDNKNFLFDQSLEDDPDKVPLSTYVQRIAVDTLSNKEPLIDFFLASSDQKCQHLCWWVSWWIEGNDRIGTNCCRCRTMQTLTGYDLFVVHVFVCAVFCTFYFPLHL